MDLDSYQRDNKLLVYWLVAFSLSLLLPLIAGSGQPVRLAVYPACPRPGEPILAVLWVSNPTPTGKPIFYTIAVNGHPVGKGSSVAVPLNTVRLVSTMSNPPTGMDKRRVLTVHGTLGDTTFTLTKVLPPYPPQALMSYPSYDVLAPASAARAADMKAGLACVLVLVVLLAFLELAEAPSRQAQTASSPFIRSLRSRVPILIWVLLADLAGIVLMRIAIVVHWWP